MAYNIAEASQHNNMSLIAGFNERLSRTRLARRRALAWRHVFV